jgi:hypothetical protein
MLEKIVYIIRDQSAIFQLAILSSLAGTREYIMYCSLKNQALSSLRYSVIYYSQKYLRVFEVVRSLVQDKK